MAARRELQGPRHAVIRRWAVFRPCQSLVVGIRQAYRVWPILYVARQGILLVPVQTVQPQTRNELLLITRKEKTNCALLTAGLTLCLCKWFMHVLALSVVGPAKHVRQVSRPE